jgi:hypothetical protein
MSSQEKPSHTTFIRPRRPPQTLKLLSSLNPIISEENHEVKVSPPVPMSLGIRQVKRAIPTVSSMLVSSSTEDCIHQSRIPPPKSIFRISMLVPSSSRENIHQSRILVPISRIMRKQVSTDTQPSVAEDRERHIPDTSWRTQDVKSDLAHIKYFKEKIGIG